MPPTPQTLAAVDRYWSGFLGCPPAALAAPGTTVLPHAELEHYAGLFIFVRGDAALISAPPDEQGGWRERLGALPAAALLDADALARRLGLGRRQLIGPASLAYADAASLRPLPTPGARLLTTADEAAYEALRAACPPVEWEHGGSELALLPLAGQFARGELVALAGYELWGERIAHIAVITHPAQRGRGHGAAVVSLLAETVVARGMVAQYRTLSANAPSMKIAESLGFAPYAQTLAVRLPRPAGLSTGVSASPPHVP